MVCKLYTPQRKGAKKSMCWNQKGKVLSAQASLQRGLHREGVHLMPPPWAQKGRKILI